MPPSCLTPASCRPAVLASVSRRAASCYTEKDTSNGRHIGFKRFSLKNGIYKERVECQGGRQQGALFPSLGGQKQGALFSCRHALTAASCFLSSLFCRSKLQPLPFFLNLSHLRLTQQSADFSRMDGYRLGPGGWEREAVALRVCLWYVCGMVCSYPLPSHFNPKP